MKTKKVAIIYSGARYFGGIETYLARYFALVSKKELELTLMSLGEWPLSQRLQKEGQKVIVLSPKRLRFKTLLEISGILKNNGLDLVVSQGVVANTYTRLASWFTGVPNLVVVHSDINYDYPRLLIRLAYKFSDFILRFVTVKYIVVSEYLKSCLVKSGVKESKIAVIYNGVNKETTMAGELVTLPDLQGKTVISAIGRLHKVKGFDNLLRAIYYMKRDDIHLLIAGDGEEKDTLHKLVAELGVGHLVTLLGYVENTHQLLEVSDIYVQPSLAEGFGIAVLDALLAKRAVVVTPVGSLPELVQDGVTGTIANSVEPRDLATAIGKLVDDVQLRQKIGEQGGQIAKKQFSEAQWVAKTTKVLRETAR